MDLNASEKREFEVKKRLEIRQKKTNPVIKFIYGEEDNRKTKKYIQNYKRKYPKADVQVVEPKRKLEMAS
jgi:hypothetical protein